MPILNRYSVTTNGAMTFTGNTLGLSQQLDQNRAGTQASIGAFITPNATTVNNFPLGTTLNYVENGSSAELVLPTGSTVLYAELIWGGNYLSRDEDISSVLNNPITFETPLGTNSITSDIATRYQPTFQSPDGFDLGFYTRSDDVTALVQSAGAGTYFVGGVPGLVDPLKDSTNETNYAGWTLAVIYQNPNLPLRNMTLNIGAEAVSAETGNINFPISGFLTPSSGSIAARMLLSTAEGDATIPGDFVGFGETAGSLYALSGPNNPQNNFFGSQINNDLGTLNTTGTFGSRNQSSTTQTNTSAGRQGWDITNIDVSYAMANNQSSGVVQLGTAGDRYMVKALGLQIDVANAELEITKSVDKTVAEIGDVITYSFDITNNGTLDAEQVLLTDLLPLEASYNNDCTKSTPGAVTGTPNTGLSLGTITGGDTVTVSFSVTANSLPAVNPIVNTAALDYSYDSSGNIIDASADSNNVSTIIINQNPLTIVKAVDKIAAAIGEEIEYSIVVNNTSLINNDVVNITDALPSNTSFVAGSLSVSPGPFAGTIATGIQLGTMQPATTQTITFKVTVNNNTAIGTSLDNSAVASFSQVGTIKTVNSNIVNTIVSAPNFSTSFIKSVDKSNVDLDDVVTYTFNITNNGNTTAKDVNFSDALQAEHEFLAGSVVIGVTPQLAFNPNNGFSLGDILAGGSKQVSFKATVTSIPTNDLIQNSAEIDYTFVADANNPTTQTGNEISNMTTLLVQHGQILAQDIIKSANKTVTTAGDIITYTVNVTNSGNADVNTVTLNDVLPTGTTFVNQSVLVSGVPNLLAHPETGISIGTIAAGETVAIIFNATVNSNAPSTLSNTASVNYNYNVGFAIKSGDATSNAVNINVIAPTISLIKTASKTKAVVDDIITYTLTVKNTGNTNATKLIITDPLTSNLQFSGNMTLNGNPVSGNITLGLDIGTLLSAGTAVISFDAKVLSVPTNKIIENISNFTYEYSILGNARIFTGSGTSNPLNINILAPKISMTKQTDKTLVKIGDTFNYTMTIINTGDTIINGLMLQDMLPSSLSVLEIKINGVLISGNLRLGLNLGSITPTQTITVSVKVKVLAEIPIKPFFNSATANGTVIVNPNQPQIPVSATATENNGVIVVTPNLNIIKSSNVDETIVGDILTYTLLVNNDGDVDLNNVTLKDTLSPDLKYITDSVTIDGLSKPDESIIAGVDLDTVTKGEVITVTFKAEILSKPTNSLVVNKATAFYSFRSGANQPLITGTSESNENTVKVDIANLTITKVSDKASGSLNDKINYTIKIINDGNIRATNVLFTDTLPTSTILVDEKISVDSVTINGVNLSEGVHIGDIEVGQTVKIMYVVKITGGSSDGSIKNKAKADFEYVLESGVIGNKSSNIAEAVILSNIQSFKQIIIDKYLEVPSAKPDMEDVNDVIAEVIIDNHYVIKTPQSVSSEGQMLSGYKLVVHGILKISTEYTALLPSQPVHSAHYNIPFGSFIILPSDYIMDSNIEVSGVIEGIRFDMLNRRHIFTNTAILLVAKI